MDAARLASPSPAALTALPPACVLAACVLAACVLAACVLTACDPFQFSDLEDDASVVVLQAPDGYPSAGRFGDGLTAWDGVDTSARRVSRIGVSSGAASPYLDYPVWTGDGVALRGHLLEGCDSVGECDESAGAALVGFATWRAGSPSQASGCLLVTAPVSGGLIVRCESTGGTNEMLSGPPSIGLGEAAAGLGAATGVGVAVLGAPGAMGNAGALYRMPDGGGPTPIALPAGTTSADGRLGAVVAATGLSVGRALIAAAAPGAGRVVVLTLDTDGTATVRACLDDAADGWGGGLAFGDIDGDGLPELVVGHDPGDAGAAIAPVSVYPGTALPDPGGCGPWGAAPTTVTCPDALGGIDCAGSGFGRAVAIGDVDADGDGDLLVGASSATVDGKLDAGAVYLFTAPDLMPVQPLVHSSPEGGDRLGSALTVVATGLGPGLVRRDEPVAASPGRHALLVFLCTGVDGDSPRNGDRCVPR